MTELKCPYCNKPLVDRGYYDYMCPDECDGAGNIVGNESMWARLIATQKKLEYAGMILKNLLPHLNGYERLDVQKALKRINQKEEQ